MGPKPKPKKIWNYPEESMLNAIQDVKRGVPIATAAKQHGVPRITLMYKAKGKSPIARRKGPCSTLNSEEEKTISDWIVSVAKSGFPVSKDDVLDSVQQLIKELKRENKFVNDRPGRTWFSSFLRRNPKISSRVAQNLTSTRAAVREEGIQNWYREVEIYLKDKGLFSVLQDPTRVFNADESAFFLNPKGSKVLAQKGDKSVYQQVNPDEKECLTVLFTGNADGQLAPPLVVFKYERIPQDLANSVPKEWGIGKSETGWMTGALFYEFIANVFYPWLVEKKIQLPVFLFIDGHSSHLTLHTSRFCDEHGIIVIALLPNATHLLQPMDVAVFRSLKMHWKAKVHEWRLKNTGNPILKKKDFSMLLKEVIDEKYSQSSLQSGFRKCGIVPWDPSAPTVGQKKSAEMNTPLLKEKDLAIGLHVLEHFMGEEKVETFTSSQVWDGVLENKSLFEVWQSIRKALDNSRNPNGYLSSSQDSEVSETVLETIFQDADVIQVPLPSTPLTESVAVIDRGAQDLESIPATRNVDSPLSPERNISNTSHVSQNKSIHSSLIPSPFKRALFWPEPLKSKKRKCSKEIIPSVITSQQWQEYHERKEMKKRELEEQKKQRALNRMKKKEEKEEEQRRKAQEKANKTKPKPRRKKKKTVIDSSSGDESEWIPSGSSIDDVTFDLQSSDEFQSGAEIREEEVYEERGPLDELNLQLSHSETAPESAHENDFIIISLEGKKKKVKQVCHVEEVSENEHYRVIPLNPCNRLRTVFMKNVEEKMIISSYQVIKILSPPLIFGTGENKRYQFETPIEI
ncbi:tigger transposable element-derived protein 2-like [Anabrus simplex]|uniref:tigger transposable element-derived protein 2-like n=1 Tax=Anabrus simplex TaxID=316456 RepID=UPI0035A2F30B